MNISEKMVLGTAQFGMDYGIVNLNGKLSKHEVFRILDCAWENGIRRFDTAPGYGSEVLLGEFITANGLQNDAMILSKIPSIMDVISDYETFIKIHIDSSLKNLGCPIDILFFHDAQDSRLLLDDPGLFEDLMRDYSLSTIGVSVYEPQEVENLSGCHFELAFQFPFNVLDQRFEQVIMPRGMRYARSIFLQGILASDNDLRLDTPVELFNLQKDYHDRLADHFIDPVSFAVSFVANNDVVDYFLFGVDSAKQLQDILALRLYEQKDTAILDTLQVNTAEKWLDPRYWMLQK